MGTVYDSRNSPSSRSKPAELSFEIRWYFPPSEFSPLYHWPARALPANCSCSSTLLEARGTNGRRIHKLDGATGDSKGSCGQFEGAAARAPGIGNERSGAAADRRQLGSGHFQIDGAGSGARQPGLRGQLGHKQMSPFTSCNAEFRMHSHAENMKLQESASTSGIRVLAATVRDFAIVIAFQMILRATLM